MDINNKNMPSENIQKEFENNPLKILETIRNEKEYQTPGSENPITEKDKKIDIINSFLNNLSSNKGEIKMEESKIDSSENFDFVKRRQNQKDINRKKINSFVNNINNLNTNNNFNCHNTLINYNPNINFNKNSNIIVNHLNIFFNFNSNNNNNSDNNFNSILNNKNNLNNLFVNKNINNNNIKNDNNFCMNNKEFINPNYENVNILCNNNKKNSNSKCKNDNIFCINNSDINDTNSLNFEQSNKNNGKNLLLLKNINKLLNNLKCYKGSIISQAYIDNIDDQNDLELFFKDIIPHICEIMCLEYGNYFFQKLIKKLNFQQRLNIYQVIEPEFLAIATNKCGTHSIQSLMDTIQTPIEHFVFNKLISKNMLILFIDDNAYHIMMKMILDFPEEKRNLLNIYLVMNIEKIIINCNGAFCVNKFIINNKNLTLRKLLVENLKKNIKDLIFNKYSCINLLLVLQTFGTEWGDFIIKELEENFVVLSENPISNVFISKVLEFLKNGQNYLILKSLIWTLYKNIVLMNYLISNKSHKKLLNQLIECSDKEQKKYLYVLIKQCKW